jgi:hypothetical protein
MTTELNHESLKKIVLDRRLEVLSILYLDATTQWATVHMEAAHARGQVEILKAEIIWLQTVIEHERKRITEEPKCD